MATKIEAHGVTVDEAIQLALNQLGVGRDKVEIQIVHHPRKGFLGIGARRAKVRATLRERAMEDGEEFDMASGERRRRRRRQPRRRRGEQQRGDRDRQQAEGRSRQDSGGRNRQDGGGRGRQQAGGRGRQQGGGRDRQQGDGRGGGRQQSGDARQQRSEGGGGQRRDEPRGERQGATQQGERAREGQPERQRQGRRRGGRGRRRGEEQGRSPDTGTPAPAAGAAEDGPPREQSVSTPPPAPAREVSAEEIRERAGTVVAQMTRMMGIEAKVDTELGPEQGEVTVQVQSEAEGLLIGRRGQTLDAVEHLVNRMVLPRDSAGDARVAIDIGGYRERRRESLVELAGRLRARAVAERRKVQVSPMNARDRRVFEETLAGDEEVETRVLGSGFYRRILLVPTVCEDVNAPPATAGHDEGDEPEGAGDAQATDRRPAPQGTPSAAPPAPAPPAPAPVAGEAEPSTEAGAPAETPPSGPDPTRGDEVG